MWGMNIDWMSRILELEVRHAITEVLLDLQEFCDDSYALSVSNGGQEKV
jgi:hypothetical protein